MEERGHHSGAVIDFGTESYRCSCAAGLVPLSRFNQHHAGPADGYGARQRKRKLTLLYVPASCHASLTMIGMHFFSTNSFSSLFFTCEALVTAMATADTGSDIAQSIPAPAPGRSTEKSMPRRRKSRGGIGTCATDVSGLHGYALYQKTSHYWIETIMPTKTAPSKRKIRLLSRLTCRPEPIQSLFVFFVVANTEYGRT